MSDIAIRVEKLGKKYTLGGQKSGSFRESLSNLFSRNNKSSSNHNTQNSNINKEFWALQDVNFEIKRGEAVGIIGRNGAGKSTLLKILSRITEPTKGRYEIFGRVSSLLEVGTGFHPELSGRENVYLNGTILGMKRKEVKAKFDEIVAFSGVEKFIDTPVKHYSSGMQVRLAFAVAAHLEPEILIIDEVLAVGDAEFQKKCLGKMEEVTGEGRTVLFVSHNMGAVQNLCNKGILLNSGKVIIESEIQKVVTSYLLTTKTKSDTNIEKLTERSGNQSVIFADFWIESLNGQLINKVLTGEDIFLVFKVKANKPSKKINIGFSIHNHLGANLSVLYSGYQSEYFTFHNDGYQEIKCLIRNINLSPGLYMVKGRIEEEGLESDWPKFELGRMDIEMGDYYGTGNLGFNHNTPILIKGEWQ